MLQLVWLRGSRGFKGWGGISDPQAAAFVLVLCLAVVPY